MKILFKSHTSQNDVFRFENIPTESSLAELFESDGVSTRDFCPIKTPDVAAINFVDRCALHNIVAQSPCQRSTLDRSVCPELIGRPDGSLVLPDPQIAFCSEVDNDDVNRFSVPNNFACQKSFAISKTTSNSVGSTLPFTRESSDQNKLGNYSSSISLASTSNSEVGTTFAANDCSAVEPISASANCVGRASIPTREIGSRATLTENDCSVVEAISVWQNCVGRSSFPTRVIGSCATPLLPDSPVVGMTSLSANCSEDQTISPVVGMTSLSANCSEDKTISSVIDSENRSKLLSAVNGISPLMRESRRAEIATSLECNSVAHVPHVIGSSSLIGNRTEAQMAPPERNGNFNKACDNNFACAVVNDNATVPVVDNGQKGPDSGNNVRREKSENGSTETRVELSDMSRNLRELQLKDPYLKQVIEFIETDVLPKDDKLSRKIVIERDLFFLNEDLVLCRSTFPRRKKAKGTDELFENDEVLVLPDAVVPDFLHGYHDLGHSGISRLAATVSRKYYFRDFHKKIRDFVRNCRTCALAKTHLPPRALLGRTPLATRPGDLYSIDLVCGLTQTRNGNRYIITIQDEFSRYIWLFPVKDMTSETICEKLLVVIAAGGVPSIIITDLAPNLIGNLMSQIYKLLGIEKKQTMAYSSKSLGKHERFHRTMAASIRCLLLDLKEQNAEWDTVLPIVEFAFRSSVNAETHLSPMDLWLGRDVRMPVDLTLNTGDTITSGSPEEYVKNVRRRLEFLYKIQADQESASREKMIQKYNERARPVTFLEGDLVFVNNLVLDEDKTRKLQPHWKGPYVVEEVCSPHSLRLRDLVTKKELPSVIHVDRVKKCWTAPEVFLEKEQAKVNPPTPEAIIDQKGQRFLVRYRAPPDSPSAGQAIEKWLKEPDIPSALMKEWRTCHRKDGKMRIRRSTERNDVPPVSSEDEETDVLPDVDRPQIIISPNVPQVDVGKGVLPKKRADVADDVAAGRRRSPRNLPRLDYKELSEYGFE